MHPNLVVCIFATAFVLIQCEFKSTSCSVMKDHAPQPFSGGKDCRSDDFRKISHSKLLAPQALDRFVKLGGNPKNKPSMVLVKRCDGQCSGGFTLQAVNSSVREFPAIQYQNGKLRCGIVGVEEHTKCACNCLKKESDCVKPQKLHDNTCTCKCPYEYDNAKFDCGNVTNSRIKYWNEETCSCECNENDTKGICMTASTKIWNTETCSCK